MTEQLRLDGIVAPYAPFRLRPAALMLVRAEIARCREILAAARDSSPI